MPLIVRPIEELDYPSAAKIHNRQNEPDMFMTAEQMQQRDTSGHEEIPEYARLVAESNGSVVGTATITSRWGGLVEPHRYWMLVATHEDFRHQGVDAAMIYGLLETVKQGEPHQLWTCIREDFVPAVEFLKPFGFAEAFRSWGSHFDVQAFDFGRFRPLVEKLESTGIRFSTYAALDDAGRESKLLTLHRQLEEDAPHYEPIIPKGFEDIRQAVIPDESCFVALDGDKIVGMACLNTEYPDHLQNGLTGVHRAYRNRGIATALKALVANFAKEHGHTDINAAGSGENQAMQRVNRKLGYDIEPPWITYKSELPFGATGTRTGGLTTRKNWDAISARTHAPTDCRPTRFVCEAGA